MKILLLSIYAQYFLQVNKSYYIIKNLVVNNIIGLTMVKKG